MEKAIRRRRPPAEPLEGPRFELELGSSGYPKALANLARPPKRLYGVGCAGALSEGLAVVGARKATPYGRSCARRFATMAAERGVTVISGGARGCDAVAHEAALAVGAPTVAFLGGGCDRLSTAGSSSASWTAAGPWYPRGSGPSRPCPTPSGSATA